MSTKTNRKTLSHAKRTLGVALAFAFVLMLAPMFTLTASAAAGISVNGGTPLDNAAAIQTAINGATPVAGIITVTGSLTEGITSTLNLAIPAGVTVRWQAEYSVSVVTGGPQELIMLTGNGTFEVADGGALINSYRSGIYVNGSNTVLVSGGRISVSNGAIFIPPPPFNTGNTAVMVSGGLVETIGTGGSRVIISDNPNGSVTVSGGRVVASSGSGGNSVAISSTAGSVTVSGGEVRAYTGGAISAGGSIDISGGLVTTAATPYGAVGTNTGTITISGNAVVENTNTSSGSFAIYVFNGGGTVNINGGTVKTFGSTAVFSDSSGHNPSTVNINGGVVFACNSGITTGTGDGYMFRMRCGGNAPSITGTGAVVAWNQAAGTTEYEEETRNDLISNPPDSAQWATPNHISHANGTIEISGVTVTLKSPPTGIPGIRGAMAAMIVFIIFSAALWGYILRRRLRGNNV